jgi:hypothetical protein
MKCVIDDMTFVFGLGIPGGLVHNTYSVSHYRKHINIDNIPHRMLSILSILSMHLIQVICAIECVGVLLLLCRYVLSLCV